MSNSLLPFLWFIAIVALIPLALWLLKRTPLGSAGANAQMRVIGALPVSPQQRLLMVEVGQGEERRWLVLGVTPQNISTLHTLPPQSEAPVGTEPTPTFAQALAQTMKSRLGGNAGGKTGGGDAG